MNDYAKPYRGVAWFGLWASDTADDYGRRDAVWSRTASAVSVLVQTKPEDRSKLM